MGPRASARGNAFIMARVIVPSGMLQWGRARPHAEIIAGGGFPVAASHASMGPRASARGNREILAGLRSDLIASMGPRASARGNIVDKEKLAQEFITLQWGRARPHAEISQLGISPSRMPALQWGRARPHAEIHSGIEIAVRTHAPASMGPRASARGNHPTGHG